MILYLPCNNSVEHFYAKKYLFSIFLLYIIIIIYIRAWIFVLYLMHFYCTQYGIEMLRKEVKSFTIFWYRLVCLVYITIFTSPSARAGYGTRSVFKRSLKSEFSFSKTSCLTKAEDPSLPYYLPIAGGRIIGFISFPRVSVLCEMLSVSSMIWTRVAVSISYDDNH